MTASERDEIVKKIQPWIQPWANAAIQSLILWVCWNRFAVGVMGANPVDFWDAFALRWMLRVLAKK